MYIPNPIKSKAMAIVFTIAGLSITSSVQAHDDDYLPVVPFIVYQLLSDSHYQTQYHHAHKIQKHHQQPRRHSQSYSGYSRKYRDQKYTRF